MLGISVASKFLKVSGLKERVVVERRLAEP